MNRLALIAVTSCLFVLAGCEQKPSAPAAGSGSGGAVKSPAGGADKPAPARPEGDAKISGGAVHGSGIIELGTTTIGDLTVPSGGRTCAAHRRAPRSWRHTCPFTGASC